MTRTAVSRRDVEASGMERVVVTGGDDSVMWRVTVNGDTVVVSSERVGVVVCVITLVSVGADVMGRVGAEGVVTLSSWLLCFFM